MKKILENIEIMKQTLMTGGVIVLIGCGILFISGCVDAALKSAGEFLALYMLLSTVILTIEGIAKAIMKKKEEKED